MQLSEHHIRDLFERCAQLIPAGRLAEAIPLLRQLLHVFPGNANIRNNLADALTATGGKALLSDFSGGLTLQMLGTHLLVACMPKSGSSFLANCLLHLTGFAQAHWSFAYMQAEQEIYLPHVLADAQTNTVVQQHCRATEANLQILEAFRIRPIVLARDLTDVAVSLLDFYDGGASGTSFLAEDLMHLDTEGRIDALIDIQLPWYMQFYASWDRVRRSGRIDALWLTYAEMLADKPATLTRIARFYGFDWTAATIAGALATVEHERDRNRFNQGRNGRGAEVLSPGQKARLAGLARHFPSVDFTPVGL